MNNTSTDHRFLAMKNDLDDVNRYIYMIVYPIIFLIGLIGNLLSILLFSITELSQTTCGIYFLLLALSSILALTGGLHHCLTLGYHVSIPNAAYCRIRNLLLYTSMDLSSWMIVALSVDRLCRVKFPIQARIYCTRKVTMIICGILTIVLVLKNIHLSTGFIGDFTENAGDNCDPNPNYPRYVYFFKNIWPWIDLVTFALLPLLIVICSHLLILHERRKRQLKFGQHQIDRSLMKFFMISSVLFIVCNFPVAITFVVYPYVSSSYGKYDHYNSMAFLLDLLRLLSYTALALNFYFYYKTSSIFRQEAARLFQRLRSSLRFVKRSHQIRPLRTEGATNVVELCDCDH